MNWLLTTTASINTEAATRDNLKKMCGSALFRSVLVLKAKELCTCYGSDP